MRRAISPHNFSAYKRLPIFDVALEVGLAMQHADNENVFGSDRIEDHMRHIWKPIQPRKQVVCRQADARKLREQLEATF